MDSNADFRFNSQACHHLSHSTTLLYFRMTVLMVIIADNISRHTQTARVLVVLLSDSRMCSQKGACMSFIDQNNDILNNWLRPHLITNLKFIHNCFEEFTFWPRCIIARAKSDIIPAKLVMVPVKACQDLPTMYRLYMMDS